MDLVVSAWVWEARAQGGGSCHHSYLITVFVCFALIQVNLVEFNNRADAEKALLHMDGV